MLTDAAAGHRGSFSRAPQVSHDIAAYYGIKVRSTYHLISNGFSADMTEAVARLVSLDSRVAYVEQCHRGTVASITTESDPPWYLDRIDQRFNSLNNYYNYSYDGSGVMIFVVDTGVRTSHDDFGGRASFGADFGSHDCDGDSDEDVPGSDPIDWDTANHGTGVADLAAGSWYGVAKGASIVSVRITDTCTDADPGGPGWSAPDALQDALESIEDDIGSSRAVVNLSVGESVHDSTVDSDVENAIDDGIVVVAAAGNDGGDVTDHAIVDLSDVLVAAGTDQDDTRFSVDGQASDYGSTVAVFAPAVDVIAAAASGDSALLYPAGSGTSYASPIVAGIAARYLSANWDAEPSDVYDAITSNATSGVVSDAGSGSPNRLVYSGFFGPGLAGSSVLNGGDYLYEGDYVWSSNGAYKLHLDDDGADGDYLGLYSVGDGYNIWGIASGTGFYAVMQGDGNFVVYESDDNFSLWATGTDGNAGAYFDVQDDGNLVVYSPDGVPFWASNTTGELPQEPARRGTLAALGLRLPPVAHPQARRVGLGPHRRALSPAGSRASWALQASASATRKQ